MQVSLVVFDKQHCAIAHVNILLFLQAVRMICAILISAFLPSMHVDPQGAPHWQSFAIKAHCVSLLLCLVSALFGLCTTAINASSHPRPARSVLLMMLHGLKVMGERAQPPANIQKPSLTKGCAGLRHSLSCKPAAPFLVCLPCLCFAASSHGAEERLGCL